MLGSSPGHILLGFPACGKLQIVYHGRVRIAELAVPQGDPGMHRPSLGASGDASETDVGHAQCVDHPVRLSRGGKRRKWIESMRQLCVISFDGDAEIGLEEPTNARPVGGPGAKPPDDVEECAGPGCSIR